jgi:hypothetical protein
VTTQPGITAPPDPAPDTPAPKVPPAKGPPAEDPPTKNPPAENPPTENPTTDHPTNSGPSNSAPAGGLNPPQLSQADAERKGQSLLTSKTPFKEFPSYTKNYRVAPIEEYPLSAPSITFLSKALKENPTALDVKFKEFKVFSKKKTQSPRGYQSSITQGPLQRGWYFYRVDG